MGPNSYRDLASPTRRRPFPGLAKRAVALVVATVIGVLAPAGAAFAATSSTGTASTSTTSGSLSIGTTTPETISVPVGGTGTGILPSAAWSDTTGTGDGWNGTVAVSDFTYTGSWTQTSGTTIALAASTSTFTGTADGVEYTVTVGSNLSAVSTPYSWTSTDPTDSAGATGLTATNGTPVEVGTTGLYINFSTLSTYSAVSYQIKAGTQSASALSLDSSATGASITASSTTTSADPTLVGSGTTVTGGGVAQTAYGAAVTFVSAALNTGMGTYTVDPGASVTADPSSWAATYTAGVQYSIVTGP